MRIENLTYRQLKELVPATPKGKMPRADKIKGEILFSEDVDGAIITVYKDGFLTYTVNTANTDNTSNNSKNGNNCVSNASNNVKKSRKSGNNISNGKEIKGSRGQKNSNGQENCDNKRNTVTVYKTVELYYREGLSEREIAKVLNVKHQSVHDNLEAAITRLRKKFF